MSWKTVVGVLCTITVILGTYIKFFDRPPAEDTLDANRLYADIERPSFTRHGGQLSDLKLTRNVTFDRTFNSSVVRVNITQGPVNSNKNVSDVTKDESASMSKDGSDVKETLPLEGHGIKKFDWDGWVKDNNFVNIGNIWAYCDDAEPITIGKVILLDYDGSLVVSLVLNTTFDADIKFGTVEVKVMYYTTEFYHKTYDVCTMAEKFEDDFFTCPMVKGDKYYYREQPISRFMPSGEFSIDLTLRDENEKVVICGACKLKI